MKFSKLISTLLACTTLLFALSSCTDDTPSSAIDNSDDFNIVTSINPIQIITQNITAGAANITVTNMTAGAPGNPHHDYTLTNKDMKLLTDADMFIINGAGLEGYLDSVETNFPELEIVDSTVNVELLNNDQFLHGSTTTGDITPTNIHESEGVYNNHTWMSPKNAAIQALNIKNALVASNPQNSDLYEQNYIKFEAELNEIDSAYHEFLDTAPNKKVVLTHDSLFYLANEYSITVSSLITSEPDVAPSAKTIENTKQIIKDEKIKFIVVEPNSPTDIAETIASETNTTVEVIDSMLTGDGHADTYKTTMMKNLEVFKKYFV